MVLPSVAMAAAVYAVRSAFVATSRPLMRLDGVTKAPVFAQVRKHTVLISFFFLKKAFISYHMQNVTPGHYSENCMGIRKKLSHCIQFQI